MLILTIRTDQPIAEVGLFEDNKELTYYTWQAHRELSETLLSKIKEVLDKNGKDFKDLEGIVCFRGPGSFTGLRIGLTVANTLATDLDIPVVGVEHKEWVEDGIPKLKDAKKGVPVLPEYGADPHITQQKK